MAYTLGSLANILQQVLSSHHDNLWILDKKPEIQFLSEKVNLLKDQLQNSSSSSNQRLESLESQLKDAVYKLEDILETLIVNQILPKYSEQSNHPSPHVNATFRFSYEDLHEAVQVFDSIKEEMMKIIQDLNPGSSSLPDIVLLRPGPSSKNIVVGLDEVIMQLKERLVARRI